ncbi:MAG: cytochrome b/b6 domain-containing protein [Rhodobacteraceae bacterium]|nr:cytochrome b/b6 domain-containing protein [Paracoccaceae bacterium]
MRYHPVLVSLHWLLAFMILFMLLVGGPMVSRMDAADPEKLTGLFGHMTAGMMVGLLMIARLVTRSRTQLPPAAETGNALMNMAARWAHVALYALVLVMVFTGMGTAVTGDLFSIVYDGSGAALPVLTDLPARVAHGIVATLLMMLIALHVLAWAYHQFILRDGLIRRMWFGRDA